MVTGQSEIQAVNDSFASEVLGRAHASGAAMFLFSNKYNNERAIRFLYSRRTPFGALNLYQRRLFLFDSFLPHEGAPKGQDGKSPYVATKTRPSRYTDTLEAHQLYWNGFANFGYRKTAVMVQSISSHIFLVVGLHSCDDRLELDIGRALGSLESWMACSKDYLMETALFGVENASADQREDEVSILRREASLSLREAEVVREVMKGKTNKEVAETLYLSEYTVDNHLRRIYRKVGVRSRTALANIATQIVSNKGNFSKSI